MIGPRLTKRQPASKAESLTTCRKQSSRLDPQDEINAAADSLRKRAPLKPRFQGGIHASNEKLSFTSFPLAPK